MVTIFLEFHTDLSFCFPGSHTLSLHIQFVILAFCEHNFKLNIKFCVSWLNECSSHKVKSCRGSPWLYTTTNILTCSAKFHFLFLFFQPLCHLTICSRRLIKCSTFAVLRQIFSGIIFTHMFKCMQIHPGVTLAHLYTQPITHPHHNTLKHTLEASLAVQTCCKPAALTLL